MTCSVEGCNVPVYSRGMCKRDYMRWYHDGGRAEVTPHGFHPDHCGAGTSWGCGRPVEYPAHIVENARPRLGPRGPLTDNGHVLVHPECRPPGVVPVYLERLLAEVRARQAAVV